MYLSDKESGERLRILRHSRHMTREALARTAGLAAVRVAGLESGGRMAASEILVLSNALWAPTDFLIRRKIDPPLLPKDETERQAIRIFNDAIDDYFGIRALCGRTAAR